MMIHEDDLYIVIGSLGSAIAIDADGTPYVMPLLETGTPDWDADSNIEWDELTPSNYQLYMTAWQSLVKIQEFTPTRMFIK